MNNVQTTTEEFSKFFADGLMQRDVKCGVRDGPSEVRDDSSDVWDRPSEVDPVGEEREPRRYVLVYDRDRFRSVHQPIRDVDDKELFGSAGADAKDVGWSLDAWRSTSRRRRPDRSSMPSNDEENAGVGREHDEARHNVGQSYLEERDSSSLTADRRHEDVPVKVPLDRRICVRQQPGRGHDDTACPD